MAGHSKWANIKHRKARQDQKRAKVWTKVIRELTVAARLGGPLIEDNPRLRIALSSAQSANMPRDTIERAIARGAGSQDDDGLAEVTYEGYGPGGVAFLIQAMTDNRNRTVAEIRHAFSKHNGNLGTEGSVAYLFSKQGVILVESTAEDEVMEIALDAGAEDVEVDEEGISVTTAPENFSQVLDAFRDQDVPVAAAELSMVPSTSVGCDTVSSESVQALIEGLEDLDDVQSVYTNGEFASVG